MFALTAAAVRRARRSFAVRGPRFAIEEARGISLLRVLVLIAIAFAAVCHADPTWEDDQRELESRYRQMGQLPLDFARYLRNTPAAAKFLRDGHTVPLGPQAWEHYPANELAARFDRMMRGWTGEEEQFFLQYDLFRDRLRAELREVEQAPAEAATKQAGELLTRVGETVRDWEWDRQHIPQKNIVYNLLHSRHPEVRALAEAKYRNLAWGIQNQIDPELWKRTAEDRLRTQWQEVEREREPRARALLRQQLEESVRGESDAHHILKPDAYRDYQIALFEKWQETAVPPAPKPVVLPQVLTEQSALARLLEKDRTESSRRWQELRGEMASHHGFDEEKFAKASAEEAKVHDHLVLNESFQQKVANVPVDAELAKAILAHLSKGDAYRDLRNLNDGDFDSLAPVLFLLATQRGPAELSTRAGDGLELRLMNGGRSTLPRERIREIAQHVRGLPHWQSAAGESLLRALESDDLQRAFQALDLVATQKMWLPEFGSTAEKRFIAARAFTSGPRPIFPDATQVSDEMIALLKAGDFAGCWKLLHESDLPSTHPYYELVWSGLIQEGVPGALAALRATRPVPAGLLAALFVMDTRKHPLPNRFEGLGLTPEELWAFADAYVRGPAERAEVTRDILRAHLHTGRAVPQAWESEIRKAYPHLAGGVHGVENQTLLLNALASLPEISPATRKVLEGGLASERAPEMRHRIWQVIRDHSVPPRSAAERAQLALSAYFVEDPVIRQEADAMRARFHVSDEDRRLAIRDRMQDETQRNAQVDLHPGLTSQLLADLADDPRLVEEIAWRVLRDGNELATPAAIEALEALPTLSDTARENIAALAFDRRRMSPETRAAALRLAVHSPADAAKHYSQILNWLLVEKDADGQQVVVKFLRSFSQTNDGFLNLVQEAANRATGTSLTSKRYLALFLAASEPPSPRLHALLLENLREFPEVSERYLDYVRPILELMDGPLPPEMEAAFLESGKDRPHAQGAILNFVAAPKRGALSEAASEFVGQVLASRNDLENALDTGLLRGRSFSSDALARGFRASANRDSYRALADRLLKSQNVEDEAAVLQLARDLQLDRGAGSENLFQQRSDPECRFLSYAVAPQSERGRASLWGMVLAEPGRLLLKSKAWVSPQLQKDLIALAYEHPERADLVWNLLATRRPASEALQEFAAWWFIKTAVPAEHRAARELMLEPATNPEALKRGVARFSPAELHAFLERETKALDQMRSAVFTNAFLAAVERLGLDNPQIANLRRLRPLMRSATESPTAHALAERLNELTHGLWGSRSNYLLRWLRQEDARNRDELRALLPALLSDTHRPAMQTAAAQFCGERKLDTTAIREGLQALQQGARGNTRHAAEWALRQLTKQERYEASTGFRDGCARRFRALRDFGYALRHGLAVAR